MNITQKENDRLFEITACVTLKKGEGRALKAGGAWIYDNEIASIQGDFIPGDLVRVADFDGYPMGTGFINPKSKLTVRMLSRKKDVEINGDFLMERVRNAWEYRKAVVDQSGMKQSPRELAVLAERLFLHGIESIKES